MERRKKVQIDENFDADRLANVDELLKRLTSQNNILDQGRSNKNRATNQRFNIILILALAIILIIVIVWSLIDKTY